MKIVKVILSIAGTLFLAGCMFVCFVAGAPASEEGMESYVYMAAGVSVIISVFLCACVNYILYLQKKVEKLEKELRDSFSTGRFSQKLNVKA